MDRHHCIILASVGATVTMRKEPNRWFLQIDGSLSVGLVFAAHLGHV
jgi:hypothetical protein